jgi:hypothetical protein
MKWQDANMKEGKDFKFVEKETSDFYSIEILTGKWKNVIFTYGRVSVVEDAAQQNAVLKFDYKIEELGKFKEDELNTSTKFRNHIGDILVNILSNSESNIGQINSAGSSDDDTKTINSR